MAGKAKSTKPTVKKGSDSFDTPPEKKVLLFGKTGCGKSTVANALVVGGTEPVIFKSSDGAQGCTSEIQTATGRGWTVVDTVGLGESDVGTVSNVEAKNMLTEFLKSVKDEYSHIIYVLKQGRTTTMDEMIWILFSSIFEGGEDAFTVLFTATDQKWLDENMEQLPEYLTKYPILVTDIPPKHKRDVKERKNMSTRMISIQKLENDLEVVFRERKYKFSAPKIAKMSDDELDEASMSIITRIINAMKRLVDRKEWKAVASLFSNLVNIGGMIVGIIQLADP